jgi:hypothetical protein
VTNHDKTQQNATKKTTKKMRNHGKTLKFVKRNKNATKTQQKRNKTQQNPSLGL